MNHIDYTGLTVPLRRDYLASARRSLLSNRKVGGIRFIRVWRLSISLCFTKKH